MKVLKFGGTSVQNSENIKKVISIIKNELNGDKLAVVVSALGGVTSSLINLAQKASQADDTYKQELIEIEKRHYSVADELTTGDFLSKTHQNLENLFAELHTLLEGVRILNELSPRSLDLIQSYGERLSAHIVNFALLDQSVDAEYLDARSVIITDKKFTNAIVNFELTNKKIQEHFKTCNKVQVIPGFISSSIDNETTTLGRGGSDYSAAIFSAALEVNELQIWTDVDGMMTADPRIVKKAFPIRHISYNEALELSHFGSKVIHPQSIIPALSKSIPIRIKNTFSPEVEGTLITEKSEDTKSLIRGISSIDDISLLTIQGSGLAGVVGIASRLFQTISKHSINIILITQGSSEHSITFAIPLKDTEEAVEVINNEFAAEMELKHIEPVRIEQGLSIIAVVGENMKNRAGISARLFNAVGRNGISVVATAQGASELNISFVIDQKHKKKALNAIHEEYFLSDTKVLNLFVVGTGTIGGTLLNQVKQQREYLIKNNSIEIHVTGIANQFFNLVNEDGIDLTNWEDTLEKQGEKVDIRKFVDEIKRLNLRNSIFVDNTASDEIASLYKELLENNVSVVTPNKKANASEYKVYSELHEAAQKFGVRFLYETNVGAGLPIINTLQDLIRSGDKVLKIEAILSGSLNYIFSTFSAEKDFFSTVKEAKELGFTEPDPRQDLSGMDVARKILILSREIGLKINIEDVDIQSCISQEASDAESMDDFWAKLQEIDNSKYDERRIDAENNGKRLKYIATYENNSASTAIKQVGPEHPFYNIVGSNNIIAFTTERYKDNPLIVIGPGAGAEVTAAGVFADVIRIVNE